MRRTRFWGCLPVALLFAVGSLLPAQDVAPPEHSNGQGKGKGRHTDDMSHPLGRKLRAKRQKGLEKKLHGKAHGKTHQVARGQYVELEREGEDLIWTVLADFGDTPSPYFGGPAGPQHNQIPEPDRAVDNSTIWAPDFDQAHYEKLLFSEEPGALSMRNFYIEQSSNRYAVDGEVTDWGQVEYNTAHYGSDWCGSIVCYTTWWFVEDSVNDWYEGRIAAGLSPDDIDAYLSQFDVWDRYDYDGDGNFDEPDGYIDHFQSVHAGEGQETGGGSYGSDAIWSHRWYAWYNYIGFDGPAFNPAGGIQVGSSDYWIGDYTIEPENGGVGVFAHEFAHDLDLPDLYDSSYDNATGFWTLMSSGSYGSDGTVDLGTKPTHLGAWEKFQLGWLNYEVAYAGQKSEHKLGPAETNTKQAQGLFVVLPDKEVVTDLGPPFEGSYYYFSGAGDNLDNFMYQSFSLGAGASLTAMVHYDIEVDWDYAYVVVSTDSGANWTSVATDLSTTDDPNGQNEGYGITGNSGGIWVALTADLSAYTGPVLVGFRYWTDVAFTAPGFKVDAIQVAGYPVDGAEGGGSGWTFAPNGGFRVTDGQESAFYFNAYVGEFRQYRGFDEALQTGPYYHGYSTVPGLENFVDHFPYQDGLLISYWDTSQGDNDVSAHPGAGLLLPIDSHPEPLWREPGNAWIPRVQSYDSPFGLESTDVITINYRGVPGTYGGLPAVSVFDDRNQYWQPATPYAGVINPNTGTTIRVKSISAHGSFMQVQVKPAK